MTPDIRIASHEKWRLELDHPVYNFKGTEERNKYETEDQFKYTFIAKGEQNDETIAERQSMSQPDSISTRQTLQSSPSTTQYKGYSNMSSLRNYDR